MRTQLSLRRRVAFLALPALLAAVQSFGAVSPERNANDWLRGSGDRLEIRLSGEVFETDGTPVKDLRVTGALNSNAADYSFKPTIDGHRFAVWIPINESAWYSMWLQADSSRTNHAAYINLGAYQLRQAAIDGLRITLQEPARHIHVKVVDKGQPAAGAEVKADIGFGAELRSRTNAEGVARFALLPKQKLSHLTAWTDDYRIGGFSFDRKPPRDPNAGEHLIELTPCRDLKLRFVDELGKPVPDIEFGLQIGTPSPNYNFIGTNEHFRLTTNDAGDATFKWFPDWDDHHFYADLQSQGWVLDGDHTTVDGAAVFKLGKAKERKRVEGRVVSSDTSTDGFFVTLSSFQGEREHHSDPVRAFTNPDGTFAVDVLPDATYAAYVLDEQWVGDMTDLIPYRASSGQVTMPALSVSKGQTVEVIATIGAAKRPYANLNISFRRYHEFSWQENGRTHQGMSGPQWWETTDDKGRATALTLPGKLEASVYTPLWRTEQDVHIKAGEAATIRFHRDNDEARTLTGRLVLPDGLDSDLNDAEIRAGSVDGQYQDEHTVTCAADGSFSFESIAAQIGILARTKDGSAAGSLVVRDGSGPVELRLRPTLEFKGQVLGEADRPVAGRPIVAEIEVHGTKDRNMQFTPRFEAIRIKTTTDEQGNFTLRGLPSEMVVQISSDSADGGGEGSLSERIYLNANESRPRAIFRMTKGVEGDRRVPLAERYQATQRNCAASGYRLLRIMAGGTRVTSFIDQHLVDDKANPDLYSFMSVVISESRDGFDAVDAAFVKKQKWELPAADRIVVHAHDPRGKELGKLEISVADPNAAQAAAEFIKQHALAIGDSEEKWQQAFAEARNTNRRVWARVSQRHCGPCFMLARWLDDQKELISKDYVLLKIDDFHDENGKEVARRITDGGQFGIPFYAIFDDQGQKLSDSAGPLGNIGYPGSIEGKNHLRKMLLQTRQNLTDDEINTLVERLRD